jgi:hypothetical protein
MVRGCRKPDRRMGFYDIRKWFKDNAKSNKDGKKEK